MKFFRFLFTTVKGLFIVVGVLAVLLVGVVAFVVFTGGPDLGEPVVLEPKGEIAPPLDIGLAPAAGSRSATCTRRG